MLPLILVVLLAVRLWRANRKTYNFKLDRVVDAPFLPAKKFWQVSVLAASALVFIVFVFMDFMTLRSLSYDSYTGKPVLLFYPLRYGMYVITNGGNGIDGLGMNDTYRDWLGRKTGEAYMAYSVDFMKLRNDRGWVSTGALPVILQKYEGFRDQVFAPCVGTVVYTEDGHPDVALGAPEAPLGNRVVLRCFEYYVTVANLKKGSIIVKKGDKLNYQDQIGQMGSSGSPSIPHLRVFTTLGGWDQNGTPVPQIFDLQSRFLVRNDIILPNY